MRTLYLCPELVQLVGFGAALLYLYLGLVQLTGLGVVLLIRRDLLRPAIFCGAAGAVIEIGSEWWYLQDYWRPPTISPGIHHHGATWPWIEDGLYGFGVTALAACAVPFVGSLWPGIKVKYSGKQDDAEHRWQLVLIVVVAVIFMTTAQHRGGQSIYNAIVAFAAFAALVAIARTDLIVPGLVAAVLMGLLALIGYAVGLDWLVDGRQYLDEVLIYPGSRGDIRILGQVPLDEVLWNVARGACIAVMYPFLTGRRLVVERPMPPLRSNLVR